jgi:ATP-dependent phosphofructokinase / diphosphate-dependent phosphofructokinase
MEIKRVGLIFSGGPAPSANAVISAATLSFLKKGVEVVGFYDGFSHLEKEGLELKEGEHYTFLKEYIGCLRNERGIWIRTSRANPGKDIKKKEDLKDSVKAAKLNQIKDKLAKLKVDALITMGGDDTLKTANFLYLTGVPTIHIPKTIDNDYYGIAWTFGFWTAVEAAKIPLLTLKSDAESTNSYFVVELMGRKAGWITYTTGVAAEGFIIVAAEDIEESFNPDELADKFADIIIEREKKGYKGGLICIAEGIADKLCDEFKPKEIDKHGNVYYGTAEIYKVLAQKTKEAYQKKTGKEKRINSKQVGYETRTATPISYDVVLASMLGYGSSKLAEEGKFGNMVSVEADLSLKGVPFIDLIDPETMLTKIRMVDRNSDLFALKEILSYSIHGKK